ncbi:hypothetical protein N657DRAFT_652679 [Parathielavia appendiculata]|uniref:Uncharacterized protein n=1 Tax=Parathielavia appendiculata TaxID=2587402 RepID=A0AAN6Z964_9PEZI|nr:hypothetical protein N657DRAFT_652679 [Parathielavia appendiculata]
MEIYSFDYLRTWRSLSGKDVEEEMLKQFDRFARSQLRWPEPDWTAEQRKQLHDRYWKAGKPELYRARVTAMDKIQGPPKLFIANPRVDARTINPVNDGSALIRVLAVVELGKMIIDHVKPSIGDITALATSCKRAAVCVQLSFAVWDFTKGYFPTDEFIEKRDENGRLVQGGGVRTNTLIISPISDRQEGFTRPYTADFLNLIALCGAIREVPSTFRSIVLDQIPFLDVALFEMMVNTMPNLKPLKTVTITRCVRLDVTKLMPLLEVIKRHPRRSTSTNATEGKGKFIRLDFFPFFPHGPTSFERLGSFGVTYNEPTFNTPKAVFALITRCWNLAKEVGMDLVSDSSSFWSFVRQLPGPDALWAMKAREAMLTRDYDLAQQRLDIKGKSFREIDHKFATDFRAALTGDNQPYPTVPAGMARYMSEEQLPPIGQHWAKSLTCGKCELPTTYTKTLFPLRAGTCWSCKMAMYVDEMEDSHLRLWQQVAMQHWLRDLDPKLDNLHALLRSGEVYLRAALDDVACADWIWKSPGMLSPRGNGRKTGQTNSYTSAALKGLPTTTPTPKPTAEYFVPPPPRDLDGFRASLARWRWNHNPATEPFDYRKGGPQRADPCKSPISPSDWVDKDIGAEDKKNFIKRWEWTSVSDQTFRRMYRDHNQSWDIRADDVLRMLNWARLDVNMRQMVRDAERRAQNKHDKIVHRWHHPKVEDCLISMGTPGQIAFNLDKPIPDPYVHAEEYWAAVDKHKFNASKYCHTRSGW